MPRMQYFSRDGRELSEAEALDATGLVRSGVIMRVRMVARDSTMGFPRQRVSDARQLFDTGQICVTDGDATCRTANGPGWRISDSPINATDRANAYSGFVYDLENAWRNVAEEDDDDDDRMRKREPEHMINAASDGRTVDEIAYEHRQRMDTLYADHAAWLSEQWKVGK